MYTLERLKKYYNSSKAIDDISCIIPSNGFVFIIGPSGSGKSTLLRLLSFLEEPDAGTLTLKIGADTISKAAQRPWPRVTCVFQKQFLWPHLTLRQNIDLPLRTNQIADREERMQDVIELLQMSSFVDQYPNEVSGGQAQRGALARALVLQPELILLDEAHGGLDLEQQARLNTHLLELRQRAVGLIVVTHSIEFARAYADTIVVVERGKITEMGPPTILEDPKSSFLKAAVNQGRRDRSSLN